MPGDNPGVSPAEPSSGCSFGIKQDSQSRMTSRELCGLCHGTHHSEAHCFSLSTHTHKVYTDVKDFWCHHAFAQNKMSSTWNKFSFLPTLCISPAHPCLFLSAHIKFLPSLAPAKLASFDFSLLLCQCPF